MMSDPCRIIWDEVGEHIINNPKNYSYEIKQQGNWRIGFKGSGETTIYIENFSGLPTDVWGSTTLPLGNCDYGWRHLTRNGQPEPPLYPNTRNVLCNSRGSFVITEATFTVTGNILEITDNGQLFTYSIIDVNSVEVKDCCPENTLDCGDCCLDCATIFNAISAIRKSISGIK
ncbi:hypothetical protein [Anabaena lutea]|uniref:Uncharacterized protein n=1 Tax=Anabaena lutea FACHB-196 TaxID=2692881 RepID=A0ABR8FLX9_9NOST|nr:hypothetical protein [Anabaena lutea]MBD2569696.1 hypothetical protein [Anabaena lutea FACHB-196]